MDRQREVGDGVGLERGHGRGLECLEQKTVKCRGGSGKDHGRDSVGWTRKRG